MSTVIEELRARVIAGENVTAAQLATARNSVAFDVFNTEVADQIAEDLAEANLADQRRAFIARTLDNEELSVAGAAGDRLASIIVGAIRDYSETINRYNAAVNAAKADAVALGLTEGRSVQVNVRTGVADGLYLQGVRYPIINSWRGRASSVLAEAHSLVSRTSK